MDSSSHLQGQGSRGPRPSCLRASSRSSTSTVNTRATSHSAHSLSSIATSPQLSQSHAAHRFHHAACAPSSGSPRLTPRNTPRLSREASMESTRPPAASSFLQEKLQRERRAEGERLGHTTAIGRINTDMSGSLDFGRAGLDSPLVAGDLGRPRPRSSGGASSAAEQPKRQSLGLMEMEQVLSKLHKQNFDLKLELFHRREKQTALENQVEALESDKREMEQINDKLLEELDKRDKAVEEAVAMIVTLEAKVEQLVIERNVAQQFEREGYFCAQDYNIKSEIPTVPEIRVPESLPAAPGGNFQTLNRTPSFLSEKTEKTENLRDIYLGVLESALSLQKGTDGENEQESGLANGLASPTLSVLSESSFMSVYGKREESDGFPPPIDVPLSLDGIDPVQSGVLAPEEAKGKLGALPGRSASAIPFTRSSQAGPFTLSIGHAPRGYSNQQTERPSTTRSEGKRGPPPPPLQITPARNFIIKEQTRELFKRSMTEAPGGVRLHEHGFPPTPDTISTSGLDQMRTSDDSLAYRQVSSSRHRPRSFRDSLGSEDSHRHDNAGASLVERSNEAKKKSARDSRRGALLHRSHTTQDITKRCENNEYSAADSDDESDSRSLQSSMDIWMRQSTKPAKKDAGIGTGTGSGSSTQTTPDLFGFPSNPLNSTWAPQAVFGSADTRPGQQGIGFSAGFMDDLLSLRQTLFAANVRPAGPHRGLSLHARTDSSPEPRRATLSPAEPEANLKSRHFRGHSETQAHAMMQAPVKSSDGDKKSHYPPLAGQQGGARTGLNRLFRRSTGDPHPGSTTPKGAPAGVPGKTLADAPKMAALGAGLPFWINRAMEGAGEDARSGATPPPILMKPRQMRRNTAGAEMMPANLHQLVHGREPMGDICEMGGQTPISQKQSAPGTPSGTGIRRKWLPAFSRTGSIRRT